MSDVRVSRALTLSRGQCDFCSVGIPAGSPVACLHDLAVTVHRMLDRDLPIASPSVESFPINDRIGNTVCTAALMPLRAMWGSDGVTK
ncbi:MAG: hypothetical protein IID31_07245 [Planctomycetes bacterium]|nr:hypothetical protein [Planctomycetota bacterium]